MVISGLHYSAIQNYRVHLSHSEQRTKGHRKDAEAKRKNIWSKVLDPGRVHPRGELKQTVASGTGNHRGLYRSPHRH